VLQRVDCPGWLHVAFTFVRVERTRWALRAALLIQTQDDMADMLNIERSRYGNWESGLGLIPVIQAIKVREITGATLDYIYLGDVSGLTIRLAAALKSTSGNGS
jgi:DNA-binding XRE family transcriptional regulator